LELGAEHTTRLLSAVVLALLISVYVYLQLGYALEVDDYISDEVWYVSSARNYLNKVFGVYPRVSAGLLRVTLELYATSREDYLRAVEGVTREVELLGGRVVRGSEYYGSGDNPLYGLCVDVAEDYLQRVVALPRVVGYSVGYCYPNAGGVLRYMNLEHPPLGKYLVALSMVLCGDRPYCWRIPSIASGAGVLALQYLLVTSTLGGFWGYVLGVTVPLVTAFDKTFRSLTLVAMLDAPLTLFTYLAVAYVYLGKVRGSTLALSLAFSTKFNGAFTVPALYLGFRRRGVVPALAVLLLIYAPLAVFVVLSTPLIAYKVGLEGSLGRGLASWWAEAVEGSIRWHLRTKTEPGRGPPTASPWDWLAGLNPFILRYRYVEGVGFVADLVASGNPVLYIATAVLSLVILPKLRELPDRGWTWVATWSTWLMYVALWVAGNRSQYSFYMVQLAPLLYTLLAVLAYYLSDVGNLKSLATAWLGILRRVVQYLRGEVSIRVEVRIDEGKRP